MKFIIEYNNNVEQRILTYLSDDYSFDMEPVVLTVNFDVVLNKINLAVVGDNKKIVQIWGFCPYGSWIKTNYSVPSYKKGLLKVKDELEPGFSYGINNEDWPIYVNKQAGWVCIGNPKKTGSAVEFINNCVAVVGNDGDLISLWLKPQILPTIS